MFELGELHGKALGTAFQKEHSSLQRRSSFVMYFFCSNSDWVRFSKHWKTIDARACSFEDVKRGPKKSLEIVCDSDSAGLPCLVNYAQPQLLGYRSYLESCRRLCAQYLVKT